MNPRTERRERREKFSGGLEGFRRDILATGRGLKAR
jgi:hypothetical protein